VAIELLDGSLDVRERTVDDAGLLVLGKKNARGTDAAVVCIHPGCVEQVVAVKAPTGLVAAEYAKEGVDLRAEIAREVTFGKEEEVAGKNRDLAVGPDAAVLFANNANGSDGAKSGKAVVDLAGGLLFGAASAEETVDP